MAEEKTYTQLVDEAKYRADMELTIPRHGAKKYKKAGHEKTSKFEDLKIGTGTRVIAVTNPNENAAYLLCTVLDFEGTTDFWWGCSTKLIVQVNAVSQERLKDQINRLRIVHIDNHNYGYTFGNKLRLIDVGKANWKNYLPSGMKD